MKTVTLDTARRLRDAGVEIEAFHSWNTVGKVLVLSYVAIIDKTARHEYVPAPNTDELLGFLLSKRRINEVLFFDGEWILIDKHYPASNTVGGEGADGLAECILWLVGEGVMTV